MTVELLTDHHLEFLGLKGGCTGSSESSLVKCNIVGNHKSRLICNLCGPAAAGEIPSSEQVALYGLHGHRDSICPCLSEGYLVAPEKARC